MPVLPVSAAVGAASAVYVVTQLFRDMEALNLPHTPPALPRRPGLPRYAPDVPQADIESGVVVTAWRLRLPILQDATPIEALTELAGILFEDTVDPRSLTAVEVTEGIRRALLIQSPVGVLDQVATFSEVECVAIAKSLLQDAGLLDRATAVCTEGLDVDAEPLRPFMGVQGPHDVRYHMFPAIKAALAAQTLSTKLLLNAAGLKSRNITTSLGVYHVLDSAPAAPPSHRPVVLLHGAFTNSQSMAPLALLLAQHRRVLVVDLLDFDFSFSSSAAPPAPASAGVPRSSATSSSNSRPPTLQPSGTADRCLEWGDHMRPVAELLSLLSPGQSVDVIGHSYGGWLAVHLCHEFPDLVRRLVLLAPGGLGRYRILQSVRSLATRTTTAYTLAEHMPVTFAHLFADILRSVGLSSYSLLMLRSINFQEYTRRVRCKHETLLLWGSRDVLHAPWQDRVKADEVMLRDLERGEGYWIEGASHSLNLDGVMAVYKLAEPFLDKECEASQHGEAFDPGTRARAVGKVVSAVLGATDREVTRMKRAPPQELLEQPARGSTPLEGLPTRSKL